jgi:hypothetical protein
VAAYPFGRANPGRRSDHQRPLFNEAIDLVDQSVVDSLWEFMNLFHEFLIEKNSRNSEINRDPRNLHVTP